MNNININELFLNGVANLIEKQWWFFLLLFIIGSLLLFFSNELNLKKRNINAAIKAVVMSVGLFGVFFYVKGVLLWVLIILALLIILFYLK